MTAAVAGSDNATSNLKGSSHGNIASSMGCLIYFVLHIVMALKALLASCCGTIGSGSARHGVGMAVALCHNVGIGVACHAKAWHFLPSCHGFIVSLAVLHIVAQLFCCSEPKNEENFVQWQQLDSALAG